MINAGCFHNKVNVLQARVLHSKPADDISCSTNVIFFLFGPYTTLYAIIEDAKVVYLQETFSFSSHIDRHACSPCTFGVMLPVTVQQNVLACEVKRRAESCQAGSVIQTVLREGPGSLRFV